MALLPYCVLLKSALRSVPENGVRGSGVQSLQYGGLSVLYSTLEKNDISAGSFRESALEFHNAVHAVFADAAVIPFRFPTWLSAAELSQHLETEALRYETFLTQHADDVQMELRFKVEDDGVPKEPTQTGTEHLRLRAAQLHKMDQAAAEYKQLLFDEVSEWRERDIPDGKRLFALVPRTRVPAFREKLSGRRVRCTGPWPATEFFAK